MPSFADLKAKATNAKDASVSKMQNIRDKNSSVPMKKTTWDPYSGKPAPAPPRVNPNSRPEPTFPPPPSRTNSHGGSSDSPPAPPTAPPRPPPRSFSSSSLSSGGPPPVNRATMPFKPSARPPPIAHLTRPTQATTIDWTNLSPQDKEVFFLWLDEFFSKFFNINIPPHGKTGDALGFTKIVDPFGLAQNPHYHRERVSTSSMKRGFLKSTKQAAAPAQDDLEHSKSDSTLIMKRGFLKTNNKVAPSTQADTKTFKPILIPAAPECAPDVPPRMPNDLNGHLRLVHFPTLNIHTYFFLHAGTKEAMLEQCEPVKEVSSYTSLPFVIKEVPGQGRGVFAKNALNTGDLILVESPIFVAPQGFHPDSVFSPEHYLRIAIDNLPPLLSSEIYKLHNCKSNNSQDVRGILETNAISIGRLPGPYEGEHMGIFHALSRINHSCAPNVEHHWNPKTFSYHLTASRHIAAGEQIFIAYLPIFRARTERRKQLKSKYAFTCTCASCTLPKDLSARSDIKRKIINSAVGVLPKQQKEHERALRQWVADLSLPDDHLLKPARFLMQLMEEEQAFDASLWLTQAEIACKALCALSDRAGAVELARKASAYAKTRFFGDDAGWSKVAVAPEKTEWWGLRKKTVG